MATKLHHAAAAPIGTGHQNPLIPHARLQQLYTAMLECRMLAERLRVHPSLRSAASLVGQEAVCVGTALGLLPQDMLSPAPGDRLTPFLKGRSLSELFRDSNAKGKPSVAATKGHPPPLNILPSAPDLVTQTNIANGVALASKLTRHSGIVLAFLGEHSVLDSALKQSLHYAAENVLPILYVQQCGALAEPAPVYTKAKATKSASSKNAAGSLPAVAAHAVPFPSIAVDGNDVVAVYRVAQECIARARNGGGPALIECHILPHAVQPGQKASNHRIHTTIDPVAAMEQYLTTKGLFTPAWKRHLASSFDRKLNAAARTSR